MRPIRFALLAMATGLTLLPAVTFAGVTPPALNGPFFFVDKVGFDKITSLANIDQSSGEICVSGVAAFVDTTTVLNRRVEVYFSSLGTIGKESDTKVDGVFTGVTIQVIVYSAPIPNPAAPTVPVLFDSGPLDLGCQLEASVRKSGRVDRVSVRDCDLGLNLANLGVPASVANPYPQQPELPDITGQQIIDSIGAAMLNRKPIKLDTVNGELRINHVGETMPPGFVSTLVCDTSED